MALEDFLAGLDPKTAKRIQTAQSSKIVRLPLASYGLTKALHGGIAKGRLATCYGPRSGGKSALFMQSIGLWQKQGMVCAWVDAERTWDNEWAAKLGVNTDELILVQSKSSGRIEEELVPLLKANIDAIVIDSISDIMPEAFVGKDGELNEQSDRKQIGAHAKAISALTTGLHYHLDETALVYLSQQTSKFQTWGVEMVPHGGLRVEHDSAQIVRISSSEANDKQIKGDTYVGDLVIENPIGRKVKAEVKKNKLGPMLRTCEYDFYYDGAEIGVDYVSEVVKEAIAYGAVDKAGAWLTLDESIGAKWQGQDKMIKGLKANGEHLDMLLSKIHMIETGEILEPVG